jgi:hypothetical protein
MPVRNGIPSSHLHRLIIPGDVLIQFGLLMVSTVILETCREMKGINKYTKKYIMPDAIMRHTVQPFTESDDSKCCDNTIYPPEDGHVDARNTSRVLM